MQVKRFVVNPLGVNCYVVYHQGEAVIVDPGEASEEILEFIQQENLQVVAIINPRTCGSYCGQWVDYGKNEGPPLDSRIGGTIFV